MWCCYTVPKIINCILVIVVLLLQSSRGSFPKETQPSVLDALKSVKFQERLNKWEPDTTLQGLTNWKIPYSTYSNNASRLAWACFKACLGFAKARPRYAIFGAPDCKAKDSWNEKISSRFTLVKKARPTPRGEQEEDRVEKFGNRQGEF